MKEGRAVDHYRVVVWMGDTRGHYGPWKPGLPLAADRAIVAGPLPAVPPGNETGVNSVDMSGGAARPR